MSTRRAWMGFWLVAVIWGASFLFIRIGVEQLSRLYILGPLAIVAASACYAIGGTYSRKVIQQRLEPIVVAAGSLTAAVSGVVAYGLPLFGGEAPIALAAITTRVLWAVVVLGLVNTFVAYLLFYSIIQTLGARARRGRARRAPTSAPYGATC